MQRCSNCPGMLRRLATAPMGPCSSSSSSSNSSCCSHSSSRHVASLRRQARPSVAVRATEADVLKGLKKAAGSKGAALDPVYNAASEYLAEIGVTNLAEKSRVLDIAMNPNSLFLGRGKNVNARPLDVDKDMRPVANFFVNKGVKVSDIVKIVTGHPPVLSYSPEQLEAFWTYLASIGIKDVGATIATRPNLLGLDVDKNLRKIVEYLQYVETPADQIIKYLEKSI